MRTPPNISFALSNVELVQLQVESFGNYYYVRQHNSDAMNFSLMSMLPNLQYGVVQLCPRENT